MNKYYDNFEITSLDTEILEEKDGYYVFKDTIFYGEKGGMPSDEGTINGLEVVELKYDGDTLLHKVNGTLINPIHMEVNKEVREINTSVQTAFHILDGYYAKRGQYLPAVGVHPNNQWFEVNSKDITKEDLMEVQEFMNKVIDDDVKVTFEYINGKDYPNEKYQHYDLVRIVNIGDLDSQPCGTLHLNHTSQIKSFVILDFEKTSKGTRVYTCVNKVCDEHLKNYYNLLKETGKILGVKKEEVIEKASEVTASNKALKKEVQDLKKELMDLKANSILQDENLMYKYETSDANDLRLIGQSLMNRVNGNKIVYALINDEINFAIISSSNEARNYLEKVKTLGNVIGGGSPKIVTAKVKASVEDFLNLF